MCVTKGTSTGAAVARASTRRDILWTIDEMRDDRKRNKPIEKFDSIVRAVKHDTEVVELFKFAGLNYRNARDWYPLIGLLAEIVAPGRPLSPSKGGRRPYWTEPRRRQLLARFAEFSKKYPRRSVERVFQAVLADQKISYPKGTTARTLERRRRESIRMGISHGADQK